METVWQQQQQLERGGGGGGGGSSSPKQVHDILVNALKHAEKAHNEVQIVLLDLVVQLDECLHERFILRTDTHLRNGRVAWSALMRES